MSGSLHGYFKLLQVCLYHITTYKHAHVAKRTGLIRYISSYLAFEL